MLRLATLLAEVADSKATGSSAWQLAFVSCAAVIVLLELLRGWRLGLARQIVRLLAIIAAYGAAFFGGPALVPSARSLVTLPDPILAPMAGAILGVLVYTALTSVGTILFKRTAQQKSPVVRLIYGFSGAALGVAFGAFFVWLMFSALRMIGSIAEAQVRAHPVTAIQPVWNRPVRIAGASVASAPTPGPLVSTLAQIKSSLENGILGEHLQRADPMPSGTYRLVERVGEVSSSPSAIERFLQFPAAREISENPKIAALRSDPAVMELVARNDLVGLLQNPRVIDALNDQKLTDRLKRLDLNAALDFALEK